MTMTTMTTTTTTTLLLFIVLIIISCYSSSIETVTAKETKTTNTKTTKTKTTNTKTNTKIAIIGGGISGSFITKYLTDYDTSTSSCSLDITIFDPYHTGISSSIIENEEVKEEEVKENENISIQNNQNNQNNQNHNHDHNQQGSRVSSYTLNDGITVVERGASIIFSGNKLVNDMIDSSSSSSSSNLDDNEDNLNKLIRVKPHGSDAGSGGMAIYNGHGRHGRRGSSDDDDDENNDSSSFPFPSFPLLLTNNMTSDEKKSIMIYRYNLDLYKINSATDKTIELFNKIYTDLLNDNDNNNNNNDADNEDVYEFLNSPNDIWKYIGLFDIANISFQDYLIKNLGVSTSSSLSWWIRKKFGLLLTGVIQGLVHTELYEPMNICNNNQINNQITALAALVNSAASTGDLFAIKGGNDKLITSAFQQAIQKQNEFCYSSNDNTNTNTNTNTIKRISKQVKIVVSDDYKSKIELFGHQGKLLGIYDIVIIATPLQFTGIEFLGKGSVFDSNALFDLPLNSINNNNQNNQNNHQNENENHHPNQLNNHNFLPSSATRSYTQVVTTFVVNGILNTSYFITNNDEEDVDIDDLEAELPVTQSILFTERGRNETGISSIGKINNGTFKVFSSNEISIQQIADIFGFNAVIEHVKIWGGSSASNNGSNYTRGGGATPAFNMDISSSSSSSSGGPLSPSYSTQFLLYDGSKNGGHEDSATDFDRAFPATKTAGGATTTTAGGPVGPAIYYTNAMESAVSAIEISAIGSKVVSKLIARRLGLIGSNKDFDRNNNGDEL